MKGSEIQPGKLYHMNDGSVVECLELSADDWPLFRWIASGWRAPLNPRRIFRELSEREAEAYRPKGKK